MGHPITKTYECGRLWPWPCFFWQIHQTSFIFICGHSCAMNDKGQGSSKLLYVNIWIINQCRCKAFISHHFIWWLCGHDHSTTTVLALRTKQAEWGSQLQEGPRFIRWQYWEFTQSSAWIYWNDSKREIRSRCTVHGTVNDRLRWPWRGTSSYILMTESCWKNKLTSKLYNVPWHRCSKHIQIAHAILKS